jgi:hypothetical protein
MSPLTVVAEYTMPTIEAPGRDFQALHFDFGLALGLAGHAEIARYTVLHVDASSESSSAATRIVRLVDLAPLRRWPDTDTLVERLRTRIDDPDIAEGVAGIVEAADQASRRGNSVSPEATQEFSLAAA